MSGFVESRLAPLPPEAAAVLAGVGAPPRLVAHLRLVHDVAVALLHWIGERYPGAEVDAGAVRFGAAVHDIGKIRHPEELSGPGSAHERAGTELLLARGVSPERARFCCTHAAWDVPGTTVEDLVVGLADKVWKGRRVPELEDLLSARLAAVGGEPGWQVWAGLDDVLTDLAAGADRRLAFQARHPLRG